MIGWRNGPTVGVARAQHAPIDVVWLLGHWSVLHSGQALATYESEQDAQKAAVAIERLRPTPRADARPETLKEERP